MALNDLSNEAMVEISTAWLKTGPEGVRDLLASIPETNGLLPAIERSHARIRALNSAPQPSTTNIPALRTELRAADGLHDRKLRGAFHLLEGLAELVDGEEEARTLLALRDKLFGDGLSRTTRSRRDQAGALQITAESLKDDDRALMAAIPLPMGLDTLDVQYSALEAAGERIGRLVEQIDRLNGAPSASNTPTPVQTRNLWINTAHTIRRALALSEATDAQVLTILGPLNAAERAARDDD